MKIAILYLRILKKWDESHPEHKSYSESSLRFLDSYKRFKPEIAHDLFVVNCGQEEHDGMFDGIATEYFSYSLGGYDCGTYQTIARNLPHDFVICLNTHVYFHRYCWAEPMVYAFKQFGTGVYGYTASYESHPHLRTPSIGFPPSLIGIYPHTVGSRLDAVQFESGRNNFSLCAMRSGHKAILVSSSGNYEIKEWRTPGNIFRRGDQSNCLVFDRHTDIYKDSDLRNKLALERAANTLTFDYAKP